MMDCLLRRDGPTRFERIGGRGDNRDDLVEVDEHGNVVGGFAYGGEPLSVGGGPHPETRYSEEGKEKLRRLFGPLTFGPDPKNGWASFLIERREAATRIVNGERAR